MNHRWILGFTKQKFKIIKCISIARKSNSENICKNERLLNYLQNLDKNYEAIRRKSKIFQRKYIGECLVNSLLNSEFITKSKTCTFI